MEGKQFKKIKIKNKIIFTILLSVFCIFAGLLALICFLKLEKLDAERIDKIRIIMQASVNKIKNDFYLYCKDTEDFNMLISNFDDIPLSYRERYFSDLIKKYLTNEQAANCFWVYLDCKDSNFINKLLLNNSNTRVNFFDNKKTFDVSWYKTSEDDIDVETFWKFEEAMEENYFVTPILEKRTCISAPYEYTYDYDNEDMPDSLKKKAWLVTFSAPVCDTEGNIIGVTGMDINLNSTVDYMSSISSVHSLGRSSVSLLDSKGRYIYSSLPGMIGKTTFDNTFLEPKDIEMLTELVLSGDEYEYRYQTTQEEEVFCLGTLVYLPESRFRMILSITVTDAYIKETSRQLLFNLILIFASGFLLIAVLVIGLSTRFDDEYLSNKIAKLNNRSG